jgi:hypothetical protein
MHVMRCSAVNLIRRVSAVAACFALSIFFTIAASRTADAQVILGPDSSFGSVPAFGGTGLFGTYYNTTDGNVASGAVVPAFVDPNNPSVVSFTSSFTPVATFMTGNICYPDCLSGIFNDDSGGFVASETNSASFSNGNVSNVNFFPNVVVPADWSLSGLDINGYLAITQSGTYKFFLGSDDSSALVIGGQNISGISGCCTTVETDVTFTAAGLYAISAQFLELGGGSYFDLTATDPNGACFLGCSNGAGGAADNALFYSNSQLEGAPAPTIGSGGLSMAVLVMLAGWATGKHLQRKNKLISCKR